jgi:tyrosyl-tRNA synthetase
MSKSLGNYVGINEPPKEIFGKLMSISDELMWRYLELLSFESEEKIRGWKSEVAAGRNPRDIKVLLAKEIVARFHDAGAARAAEKEFENRFRHGELPEDLPEKLIQVPTGESGISVVKVLREAGLVPSSNEAVRVIEQGGVRVDGEKVSERNRLLERGKTFVIQVGKRKVVRVTLK